MTKLLLSRLYQALFVAWSVGTVTFVMMKLLPGDMAYRIAASRYGYDMVDSDAATKVSQELGLTQSFWQQYFHWFGDLLSLDLGRSLISGDAVTEVILHHLSYSVVLALTAVSISLAVAFPIGVYCAKHKGSKLDNLALILSSFFRAQPVFVLGLILILLFSIKFSLLPAAGFGSIQYLILPSLALAISLAALSNRMVRAQAISVFTSHYFRFSRYKGLNETQSYERHGKRNIWLPMTAFVSVQVIGLIEGIVMIESLFSWPGIGHALSHAVFARDIPIIQGAALLLGLLFVFINTCADLVLYAFDPDFKMSVINEGRV